MTENILKVGVDTSPALVNLDKLDEALVRTSRKAAELEKATDKVSTGMNKAGTASLDTSRKLTSSQKAFKDIKDSAKNAGIAVYNFQKKMQAAEAAMALVGFGVAAVDEFKKYQLALTDMAKVTDEEAAAINRSIMSLPEELGMATDLMKGYYQTISAGVEDPAEALKVLVRSSKSALAAHVEQAEMITVLTKVMAGYDGEIKNVTEASDLLFAIEKKGQTSVAQLVPVLGSLASLSKEVAVNSKEMGGALALLTKTEGSTAEASTKLRSLFVSLLKP